MRIPFMPSRRLYNGIFSIPIKKEKLNDLKKKLFNYLNPSEIEYYNSIKEKVEPYQGQHNEGDSKPLKICLSLYKSVIIIQHVL